jgi:hypothetical protein
MHSVRTSQEALRVHNDDQPVNAVNTLCGQNAEVLYVKAGDTQARSNQCAVKGVSLA